MAYVLIAGGKQLTIDPKELITKANAQVVIDSLSAKFPRTAYTQQEWKEPDANATLVYTEDTTSDQSGPRIRQIMPGFQDAAQLFNAMEATSGGWEGPADAAQWVWDGKAKPADNSGGAPNAPFGPPSLKPSVGEQMILDVLARQGWK